MLTSNGFQRSSSWNMKQLTTQLSSRRIYTYIYIFSTYRIPGQIDVNPYPRGLDTVKQIALDYSRYALNTSNSRRSVGVVGPQSRAAFSAPRNQSWQESRSRLIAGAEYYRGPRAGISSYIETVRCLWYNRAANSFVSNLGLLFIVVVVVGNI